MTATLRTTVFGLLASLLVGTGSAGAQQMQPPPFEQKEPPRVLPPPPPPPPPRREEAPPPPPREPAPPAAAPTPSPAPRQPPSSVQWRAAPPAPLRPAQTPPPSAQAPPARVQAPPPSVQAPPPSVQASPARVQASPPSPARSDADDTVDDPKMWRRLGPRVSVPPPPPPAVPPPPSRAPAPPRPRAIARPAPAPAPAPLPPPPQQPPPAESAPTAAADTEQTTLVRPYTPAREPAFEPTLPRLKLGLRRFDFVRIGASNSPDGVAATQTFNSFSVDVYPVSRVVRIGLTSAFGWESGTFVTNGDYFATQTVSLGIQYRDFGRIVPFAEGFFGVGYMRRLQFDRTIPTAFWNFGADAGVEIYVARVGYLSLALGYMRPVNGFARRQIFTSVFVDTWSLKVGIGI